jgi:hypothetical protein
MFIDYIYLILILVLIGSILFFIYLSYEYRKPKPDIENFVNPTINQLPNLFLDARTQLGSFIGNYNKLLTNTKNRLIISDNIAYHRLNKKYISNLNDTHKILNLQNNLKPIPETFPFDKLIKTIKSNYNAQYLSLFANDQNKYGVLVNDKCFTVNGLCKDEYCLQNCQNNLYTTDSQKFYTQRVYSPDDVSRIMNITQDKVNPNNVYPFNIFRSKVNDKCLNITNDGLSIEKCNLNSINQQWSISPDENICLLN